MALVAGISWWMSRGSTSDSDGYFLAGRNLGGVFIAGSLLLTNLSAEQLIGLNGSAYGYNLSSMAWEVTAAVATIAMALIFLPKYLAGAFTTLPRFLADRYDTQVQQMSAVLFLLGYGLVTIPSVLYSGYFKVFVPFLMMVPGVIAYHLYGPGLSTIDLAYPTLIRDLLPPALMGFFLAVLLGAVFSSFNSLINSGATLFCLDILPAMRKEPLADAATVKLAKVVSTIIAVFSFAVAPLLYFAPEGLWQIIRIFTGFYNIPVITIVLVGLFTRNVPAIGAKLVIVFHFIAYGLAKFAFDDVITLHFLHLYAVLFVIEVAIMLAAAKLAPRQTPWTFAPQARTDMTPWRFAMPVAVTLMSAVIATYVLFSPIGLANGQLGLAFWGSISGLAVINAIAWFFPKQSKA